ncbi:RNA polymerase sigma factor [Pedobacter sp.]|uniref:RNA polymerase sigma factor n=1 Tax=Pedobacter sp. TaxID=1411316 RepID=UPI003BA9B7A6
MLALSEESDEVLFDLLKEDSERAFSVLYNRYWEKLLEIAYIKLQSQEDAEEAVQQVFMRIWNSRHQTFLKYTFRTYISAALKYTIYANYAQRKKRKAISFEDELSHSLADNSTQHWLDFAQIRVEIENLVVQLPEKCQMVYRLSREEGLSVKEISANMDISEKTVEGHLTKALKHIKGNLSMLFM